MKIGAYGDVDEWSFSLYIAFLRLAHQNFLVSRYRFEIHVLIYWLNLSHVWPFMWRMMMQACGSSGMSFPHRYRKLKTISPKKAESISVTIKELKKINVLIYTACLFTLPHWLIQLVDWPQRTKLEQVMMVVTAVSSVLVYCCGIKHNKHLIHSLALKSIL